MSLPIGIQLFSVRNAMDSDPVETLKELGRLGYDGVEACGFAGLSPADFRKACDEAGLRVISVHGGFEFCTEMIDETVRDLSTVGAEYIAEAYIKDNYRPGGADHGQFVKAMTEGAQKARAAGMQMLHHNHEQEIGITDGEFNIDRMLSYFPDDLLLPEIDMCWVRVAGQDPASFLRRYKNRCPLVHIKDFYCKELNKDKSIERPDDFEARPVGYGRMDIPAAIDAAVDVNAKWLIVEQDNPSMGLSELECAALSIQWLRRCGY